MDTLQNAWKKFWANSGRSGATQWSAYDSQKIDVTLCLSIKVAFQSVAGIVKILSI